MELICKNCLWKPESTFQFSALFSWIELKINLYHQILEYEVKQSLDRPLGLHEVEAPRISRRSIHEAVKIVSLTHRPTLPTVDIPGTNFC